MTSPLAKSFRRRGLTLVELIVSLTVFAVVSTSVVAMLQAGSQVNSIVNTSISDEWQIETAVCRIIQQTRTCTSVSVPTGTSGGTSFTIVTQPDPNNGSATYSVTYSLATVNGKQQLLETDPRYGSSILLGDVQSFDVRTKSSGSPTVILLAVTQGRYPGVTRTFRITPRNQ